MDPATFEIVAMVWHEERRNVENTFYLSLAYSGWKGFSSLNTDFFIKAENMVPVPSYEMLLFIKEGSWRETQREREKLQLCPRPAPAMISEKLPGPTRLPAYVQLLLTAVLAEAPTPPALLGARAPGLLSKLFQSQWNKFKWQVVVHLAKNGFRKTPRSYPVTRFVEVGMQWEWWRTAGWPSQPTQPRRNGVTAFPLMKDGVPPDVHLKILVLKAS